MTPTAVSEVSEQAVKAGFGLLFSRLSSDPAKSAALALAAVSVSELAALFYLAGKYRGERKAKTLKKVPPARLFYSVFPVMVSSALLPLSRTLDSVLIVRLLSSYTTRAVSLYGLYTGGALSLIDLPASLTGCLSAVVVPGIASSFSRHEEEEGRKKAAAALLITFSISVPCSLFLYFFAKPVSSLLFGSLNESDFDMVVSLIRLSSVSAAALAAVNTLSACLTGMGKAKYAAFSMFAAVVVKLAVETALVSDPAFGIGGAAVALNISYTVAFFLGLYYTFQSRKLRFIKTVKKPTE